MILIRRARVTPSWYDANPHDPETVYIVSADVEPFAPWSICPRCELFDLHSLRAPEAFDPGDPAQRAFDRIAQITWLSSTGRMPPSEQSRYEVIRTCRCGHEWGQI